MSIGLLASSCSDDDDASINTKAIISSITSGTPSVSSVSATIDHNVVRSLAGQSSKAYEIGVVYATSPAGVENGTKVSSSLNADDSTYTALLEGLQKNTTYYYKAYVALQNQVTYYSDDTKSFITSDAKVLTSDATDITSVSAGLGGTLVNVGNVPASADFSCGIFVSTKSDDASILKGYDLAAGSLSQAQAGTPYSVVKNTLVPHTRYYYKAYMKLNDGYILGQLDSVTTATESKDFVDLGLSVLWAKSNVGAVSESDAGGLYGYGDATGLLTSVQASLYPGNNIVGGSSDICVASGNGRLPSASELQELKNNCVFTDSTVNDVSGYKVTGVNGNSIFVPKTGYRNGTSIVNSGQSAYLMSGTISNSSNNYEYDLALNSNSPSFTTAAAFYGLSARAVKKVKVDFDNSKLLETTNNSDLRFEIFNTWGSTAGNSGLNASSFVFYKKMFVNFTVVGLGHLASPVTASIGFASSDWSCQDWNSSVQITGDGTYTIPVTGSASGVAVFVIDIKGQAEKLNKWHGYINSIIIDSDNTTDYYACNGEKINVNGMRYGPLDTKDDYRVELYNMYGDTKQYTTHAFKSLLTSSFSQQYSVTFEVSNAGNVSSCNAGLSFANPDWSYSSWTYDVPVTGNGQYGCSIYPGDKTCQFNGVNCLDIKNLLSKAADASVKITGIYWK